MPTINGLHQIMNDATPQARKTLTTILKHSGKFNARRCRFVLKGVTFNGLRNTMRTHIAPAFRYPEAYLKAVKDADGRQEDMPLQSDKLTMKEAAARGSAVEKDVEDFLFDPHAPPLSRKSLPGKVVAVLRRLGIRIVASQVPLFDPASRVATAVDFVGIGVAPKSKTPGQLIFVELKVSSADPSVTSARMEGPFAPFTDCLENQFANQVAWSVACAEANYGAPRDSVKGIVIVISSTRRIATWVSPALQSAWRDKGWAWLASQASPAARKARAAAKKKQEREERKAAKAHERKEREEDREQTRKIRAAMRRAERRIIHRAKALRKQTGPTVPPPIMAPPPSLATGIETRTVFAEDGTKELISVEITQQLPVIDTPFLSAKTAAERKAMGLPHEDSLIAMTDVSRLIHPDGTCLRTGLPIPDVPVSAEQLLGYAPMPTPEEVARMKRRTPRPVLPVGASAQDGHWDTEDASFHIEDEEEAGLRDTIRYAAAGAGAGAGTDTETGARAGAGAGAPIFSPRPRKRRRR